MATISLREHHRLYQGFFQELCPESDNAIDIYYDQAVMDADSHNAKTQVAMLLEPRSMIADAYLFLESHPDNFRYIFTHDSRLLRLPNAFEVNWANVWLTTDSEKNKGISICTSTKNWCYLHDARLKIAQYYYNRPEVDVFFGDWNTKPIEAKDYLEHYKFSIVIENDIDDFWYTEKILNCFATKTVPIYVGARKIGERFNADGIIQLQNWHCIYNLIENLNLDKNYEYRKEAIEENFYRCVPYKISWKDRFIHDYGSLLEEMML